MRREFLTTETWTLGIYKYLLSKQSVRSPSHPGNRVYGFSPHPSILLTPNLMHCAADSQWGRGGPKLPEDFCGVIATIFTMEVNWENHRKW